MTLLIDPREELWEDWPGEHRSRLKLLLSAGRTESAEITLGMAALDPGEELPLHSHPQAETCIVLSGNGRFEVEGETTPVEASQIVFIPGNARHRIVNDGEKPLTFLFAFAANSFDDVSHVFGDTEEAKAAGHHLPVTSDPKLNNPDATPGTGMLPDIGSNDPNSQPSG